MSSRIPTWIALRRDSVTEWIGRWRRKILFHREARTMPTQSQTGQPAGSVPPYREQYDRMKRWYDKFSSLHDGRLHDVPSDNYIDDIYAFFQNAHHLKDWVRNDHTIPNSVRTSVEKYINATTCLSLCADICNSLKHLEHRNRSGQNPKFGTKHYGLSLGAGPTTISLQRYEVMTTSGAVDAFDLATDCVEAWDNFFRANGL